MQRARSRFPDAERGLVPREELVPGAQRHVAREDYYRYTLQASTIPSSRRSSFTQTVRVTLLYIIPCCRKFLLRSPSISRLKSFPSAKKCPYDSHAPSAMYAFTHAPTPSAEQSFCNLLIGSFALRRPLPFFFALLNSSPSIIEQSTIAHGL